MKVAGVDLAGAQKNPTGYCLLEVDGATKTVETRVLHTDEELITQLESDGPSLTGVDAPLLFENRERECDRLLREYGALPATLPGMSVLARRGSELAKKLGGRVKLIEVYSTASAKILGVYSKDDFAFQKKLLGLGLDGKINTQILSRDELDAIPAAMTAYLHMEGQTRTVGGVDGKIVIPEV